MTSTIEMAWTSLAAAAVTAVVTLTHPNTAEACGGTFCDTGPASMPVDQSGENIIFVMQGATTEAHIQIQYDPMTTAEKFAWVIPVLQVPSFEVSSDALFTNVLAGTVPSYGFTTTVESCGGASSGDDGGGTGAGGTTGGEETGTTGGGPQVVFEDTVGAFDIVVLQGGTAQEVMDWLAANQFEQDPASLPILDEYLSEGYLFAAFRLTNGADTEQIHPVALIFDNDEACIPIRLTRIAAVEDMDIRSFFFADHRVVPQNYRHVLVNPLKLDWVNFADNYKEVITLAVDADEANGRAFVTEYAGSSAVVSQDGIWSDQWDAAPFVAADPTTVVDLLDAQGLASCFDVGGGFFECAYAHTLIRGLLLQYLPVPAGLNEADFYGCLSCYAGQIDMMAWDGTAFSQALQERIIDPGQHAVTVLDSFPTLTRMYTTISPGEMTEDPFFYENPDLPDVDLTNEVANRFIRCNNAAIWTLPDGREVYAPNPAMWPDIPGEMPWEEEVQEIAAAGGPVSLVDNTVLIDTLLAEYNCQFDYPSPEACGNGSADTTADGTDTNGTDTNGTATGVSTSGSATDGEGSTGTAGQDGSGGDGGCGCSTRPRGNAWGLGLLGLALLGLRRRR
ncbi:DUF2330 domain-containing protein [Paraliomyxa miuraensis]|uniref:DUF2330 domain-containing protein n=1 Tax=Paraliomyxa miuraensis TaxID=376150 RepID=UPI00225453A2|nr:DUF2330 domain-containing protein [Paraliomyxa miuraensis]